MLEAFKSHLSAAFPELMGSSFLLACSGGLDSMVLAHLCKDAGLEFELAHCNFNLRGEASESDQEFVRETADKLRIKTHIKSFDTIGYANQNKVSIQMAARALRYEWFDQLTASENHLRYIVTAHHADDALETFLINLGRGSGLEGLCGIPARTANIRRPLLAFSREDLEAYAETARIAWREDASNSETRYLRNRLRHEVIPALKAASGGFLDQFGNSVRHLDGSRALIERYMDGVFRKVSRESDGVLVFSIPALRALHPREAHLHELFRDYGFTDWKALGRLLESETGREVQSPTHRLLKHRDELLLKHRVPLDRGPWSFDPHNPAAGLPIDLTVEEVAQMHRAGKEVLYVDKETLKKELTLRKWQKGDYFYPIGLNGRKRVSKFLKDAGLSRFDKETAWILCSGKDIVWVVGHRADDRFKVTESTRKILKITWQKKSF
ncbi:tRNA lysidine(34) synthetase TilS [Robiginitalea biformata]|uniref:tRNA(Ile)-lysidine synthase n=1 Tax=Robiginitalea biformata (strain ATCC BAA-864 / DSM 15991 / KCTC 12146 / HTCC2501) TaxID=313596 RepID=A4CKW5_ROBBH|nr:tRNA lysidine(34) synthetase TilS [Robiginitalea biformata]EAR15514.1 putative cell-cycle protein [Robiginitalea biformata HTCC2501]